jgi:TPR repeat protein
MLFRGKYAEVYRIALPHAEQGDAQAEFSIATIVLYAPPSSFDLVPELQRRRAGMDWLRKAADADDHNALGELASIYRWGLNGLPQDAELAQCFKEARRQWAETAACRAMEKARGYENDSSSGEAVRP